MRGGVARSCFLAFLVSVAVAALDQSNSLDLKYHGLASSGESSLSSEADSQYNPLTAAPDLNSNKLSSSGANQYGTSHQSHKTHDFQGRPLGINLHEPSDNAYQVSEEDEALRSAAYASAKGNSGGGGSSVFSTVQDQGDSSARALSGGSGYSSALAQADTSGGYSSSQADASAIALSGRPIPYGSSYPGAGYAGERYGSAQQAQTDASAQALGGGSSSYGTGYPVSGYSGSGYAGGGYGSAQADASAQALSGGSISYVPSLPGAGYPSDGYGSASAQADVSAQTFDGGSSPFGTGYPGSGSGGEYGSAQAVADASAQALTGGSISYGSGYPSLGSPGGEYGSTQAQAQADASAQVLIGGSSPYGSGFPGSAYGFTYPQSDVLGSSSAKADASDQTISGGSSTYGSGYSVLSYPSSDYTSTGYNSAQAQAKLKPSSGYPISSYSSAQAQADASSGYGNGEAQANALAEALNGESVPYNFGYLSAGAPGSAISSAQAHAETSSGYGSGFTQAEALAQALSEGSSPYQPGLPSSNASGSGYASAQAQADASAQALEEKFSPSSSVNPNYLPSGGYSSAQAEADASSSYGSAQAHADAIAQARGGGSSPFSLEYNSAQAQANAAAHAAGSSSAHASSSASAFSRPQSRVIPQQEIIYPDQIPGGNNVITCSREGELHNLWSASFDCMVCTCIRQYGSLVPLCASCGGCQGFNPTPQPQPRPFPPQPPPPLPPQPQPLRQVTCDPLPRNQYFQNPLNPCQICICNPLVEFGVPDVRITCQEKPECILPPDAPVIPVIPDVLVPLPLCERFPQNVLFPHPSDYCRLCRCVTQKTLFGIPEQRIECMPNPECAHGPPPLPPPFPPPYPPPAPPPFPPPQPQPQVSCAPLPTDQIYQNPLNPCQICVCRPLNIFGLPDVRITCQDNPQCVLPPDAPVIPPIPDIPVPLPLCERFPQNVIFPHPSDVCRLCKCVTRLTVIGIPEQHIECMPNPECDNGPPQTPLPFFPPYPPSPAPPQPQPQVSCAPLPTNQNFQNPLNPCQICMCRPELIYGVPEVKITCQQNPQCVIPPDAPVIPPIPDVPVPLPLCERLPQNVLFPHPSDYCRLCKCIVRVSLFGIPEQQIECGPNPECENRPPFPPPIPPPFFPPDIPFPPEPIYPPQPFPPSPEPRPFPPEIDPSPPTPYPQPLPFVPIIRPEPVPWPPRPGPGPLPGPAPHESCLPYTPNSPFQHPWDECQLCMCSESHVVGLVSIEVDCYTKPSCCVEPPVSLLPLPGPLIPPVTPNPVAIQILDLICEFKTFAVQFLHPKDPCKKCSCEIFGRFVIPVCQRSNKIECSVQPAPIPNNHVVYIEPRCRHRVPYKQFVINCNLCVCQTAFNYVIAKCEPQPNCYPNDLRPTPYPLYGPEGGYSHASAEANAVAQNQPGYGVPRLPGTQYLIPGQVQPIGGSASAEAHAQAITTNYPSGPGQPRNQYLIPRQPSSNYVIPGQHQPGGGTSSASAEVQAISGNYPSRPGQSGNQYLIQPVSLNLISGQPGSQYVTPRQLQPGGGYSSASADAQASSGNYPSLPRLPGHQYLTPDQLQPGGGYSSASAEAQAISENYPSRPGQPGNHYSIPSQPGGLNLIPGQLQPDGGYSSASAEAQAQAISGIYPSGPTYPYQEPSYEPAYGSPAANAQASAYAVAEYNPNERFNSGLNYPEPLSSSYAYAEASASANEQQPHYIPGVYVTPTTSVIQGDFPQNYYTGGQTGAQATADAYASSDTGAAPALYPLPSNGNSYPYTPFDYPGSNQGGYSSAQAQTQASDKTAEGGLLIDSYNNNQNSQNNNVNYYLQPVSKGGNAQYSANYDPNYSQNGNAYPVFNEANAENYYPGGQSGAQATADTFASSDTGAAPALYPSPPNGNSYPYTPFDYPGSNQGGYSSAQAQTQASDKTAEGGLLTDSYNNNQNSQNNNLDNYLQPVSQGGNTQYPVNYDPNYSQNGNAYTVFNEANAEAEAVAASDIYPSMYPRPISQKTPLYVPGQNGWDRGATPQTNPLLHVDTSAQSLAQAQAPVQAGSG